MKSLFNLKRHLQAFTEIIALLTKHRQLTIEMTKREIGERYAGQVLGVFWAIGHPLILMAVYLFIFGFVFKARIGGTRELPFDYTVYILSGLIPWLAFQESMAKSSTVITANASLVKQVVFPIEVLPVKAVLASLLMHLVASFILILYVFIKYRYLYFTYLLWPVIFFFQVLAMIGVSFMLSAMGSYFRDLKDFVQVFSVVGMYLMPIVYLPKWVPEIFRPILYLNPFSYMAWCYQDVLYFGRFEHPWAWPVFILESLVIFCVGYRVFRKAKVYFGNVL
jgi:lipopolysaccharide transport system permease protein